MFYNYLLRVTPQEKERREFQNYFNDLKKHPNRITDKNAMIETLNKTFEALGSLNSRAPKDLHIRGKTIHVNVLGPRELKTFAEFAKKFLQQADISQAQAQTMVHHLNAAAKASITVSTTTGFFEARETLKLGPLMDLRKIKSQIRTRENFEAVPEGGLSQVASAAQGRIGNLLKNEQKKVEAAENKIIQGKKKAIVANVAAVTAIGVGIASLVLGLASTGIGIFLFLVIAGATLMSGGVGGIALPWQKLLTAKPEEELNQSLEKLDQLEEYKTRVVEQGFTTFAQNPANGYDRLGAKNETFVKFLELYSIQNDYEQKRDAVRQHLEEADRRGEGQPLIARAQLLANVNPEITDLNNDLANVNKLRLDLGLELLQAG